MPKKIQFGSTLAVEPGSYAQVVGGATEAAVQSNLGTVLIIDTGAGAGWGGGAGINGALSSGLSSVYEFEKIRDFQKWMRGGVLWDAAQYVFKPALNRSGAQKLLFVSAKTTTQASLSKVLTNGTLVVKTIAEGVGANGTLTSTHLDTGFAAKLVAGVNDPAKFIWQGYVGTFRGNDTAGVAFNDTTAANSVPELLVQSIEVATLAELRDWMLEDNTFNTWFKFESLVVTSGGTIVAGDLTTYALSAFTGATEVYNPADLDDVLEAIADVDYTFILSDKTGVTDGVGTANTKIFTHLNTEAVYEKFLVIGGGKDATQFDQATNSTFAITKYYNSPKVYVAHGEVKQTKPTGGYRTYPSLYFAAKLVGLLAGLNPQEPGTWKNISVDAVTHELTKREREKALFAGVIHLRKVNGNWVINQEVNSMQKNAQQIYPDGTSPEGSIMRISSLLNKEIKQNSERQFIGQNVGMADPADVKTFTESYLLSRTVKQNTDNLLLNYANVNVTYTGGDYFVTYGFTANGPVNRMFFTGVQFTANL